MKEKGRQMLFLWVAVIVVVTILSLLCSQLGPLPAAAETGVQTDGVIEESMGFLLPPPASTAKTQEPPAIHKSYRAMALFTFLAGEQGPQEPKGVSASHM